MLCFIEYRCVFRVYSQSLYADLEIVFECGSIQTHSSFLKSRAPRLYSQLCTNHCKLPSSIILDKIDKKLVESFVR